MQHKFGTSAISWEGNRRSGVALAMCHRQWYYHLRAHGLRKGDEHPIYTPVEYGTLYLYSNEYFTCYIIQRRDTDI